MVTCSSIPSTARGTREARDRGRLLDSRYTRASSKMQRWWNMEYGVLALFVFVWDVCDARRAVRCGGVRYVRDGQEDD